MRSDQEGFDQYGFDQYGFDQHGFDQYGFDQMIEPGSRASRERQTEPVTGCHRPPPPLPLTNTSSPFSLSLPPSLTHSLPPSLPLPLSLSLSLPLSLSHTRSLALTLPVGTGPHRAAGRAVPPHHPLLPPQPLLPLPRQHPHRPHPQGAPGHAADPDDCGGVPGSIGNRSSWPACACVRARVYVRAIVCVCVRAPASLRAGFKQCRVCKCMWVVMTLMMMVISS